MSDWEKIKTFPCTTLHGLNILDVCANVKKKINCFSYWKTSKKQECKFVLTNNQLHIKKYIQYIKDIRAGNSRVFLMDFAR